MIRDAPPSKSPRTATASAAAGSGTQPPSKRRSDEEESSPKLSMDDIQLLMDRQLKSISGLLGSSETRMSASFHEALACQAKAFDTKLDTVAASSQAASAALESRMSSIEAETSL